MRKDGFGDAKKGARVSKKHSGKTRTVRLQAGEFVDGSGLRLTVSGGGLSCISVGGHDFYFTPKGKLDGTGQCIGHGGGECVSDLVLEGMAVEHALCSCHMAWYAGESEPCQHCAHHQFGPEDCRVADLVAEVRERRALERKAAEEAAG